MVREMLKTQRDLFTEWTHIGGMTLNGGSNKNTDWYWVEKQQQIAYKMEWAPYEPNHYNGLQWCLSLGPKTNSIFSFDDINCQGQHEEKFLCQKLPNQVEKIKNVKSEGFRLWLSMNTLIFSLITGYLMSLKNLIA